MTQRRQPKYPVIDWTNPLTTGLVTVVSPSGQVDNLYDPVTRTETYALNASGGGVIKPQLLPTEHGLALSNRADKQYLWRHPSLHPANQQKASILAWFRPAAHADNGSMPFGAGETASAGNHRFGFKQYSGSRQVFVNASVGGYQTASTVVSQPLEEWYLLVGTFNAAAQELILYRDGVKEVTTVLADTSGINTTSSYEYKIANGDIGDANREFTGDVLLAAVWHNRVLTAAEVAELSSNPWQIFAPQSLYVPLIPEVVTEAPAGDTATASGTPSITQLIAAGAATRTSVKITDVNTTESWTDGDTGLVITGSGFL